MSYLKPWSLTECLSNVHENYRPTVEWIFDQILQGNEPVYIAAEASLLATSSECRHLL